MPLPKNSIAYHRMKSLMSQDDVAKVLGLSQQYYGRLEKNPDKISLGVAKILKNIFQVETIDQLLDTKYQQVDRKNAS
ncbi:helix-turn-helix transcriptional regulator [Paenibacillus polymyxa]|uniref:Helix-turn-helix transcriptional regulator n=1 Tax=Paenibacillus polymyxa TaxID=1406 RepID=A0AAP3ZWP8_PAEPO|nr:helix-turn-helix transcriptional regulator [Paenibacillus polymyxa]MDH2330496.1 helix-turn-helix transcriptional regulator [Paenibacillus polymyxa]